MEALAMLNLLLVSESGLVLNVNKM